MGSSLCPIGYFHSTMWKNHHRCDMRVEDCARATSRDCSKVWCKNIMGRPPPAGLAVSVDVQCGRDLGLGVLCGPLARLGKSAGIIAKRISPQSVSCSYHFRRPGATHHVPGQIRLPMLGHIVRERVVRVGRREKCLDGQEHRPDLQRGRPLILEDVKANAPKLVCRAEMSVSSEAARTGYAGGRRVEAYRCWGGKAGVTERREH